MNTYYSLFRELFVETKDKDIEKLICKLEAEGPFNALGFFDIECSTLTTLVSTIVTYLVVLVQFEPTQPASVSFTQNSTEVQ